MKAQTVKEVLIAAKWILKHVGWCQGSYAQDADGFACYPTSYTACCFCLSGVLDAVETDSKVVGKAWDFLDQYIADRDLGNGLVGFNDKNGRTKEEVLSLLNDAIKEAT